MRITHLLIISAIVLQLFASDVTSAASATPSGLEEQFITLVADDAVAQPIDSTSRTLDITTPQSAFDAIIFNWTIIGKPSDVQLRARFLTNNRWSAWRAVVHNPEFAPDNAPRNQYTSTLFELNSLHQAWQIDVAVRPQTQSYLKAIHAITMNNQGANPRRLQLPSAATKLPRGSKPPIVSRSMWGDATLAHWDTNAAPWSGYCNSTTNTRTWLPSASEIVPASHVVIHHTAGGNHNPSTHNWPASVLAIWRYHAMTLGWCDIGYHYLIDPNGVIYEGRYTGVRNDGTVIDGAHALGHNRATIGISLMGNFETAEPNPAAILALENLLAWIGSSKNIPLNTDRYYPFKAKMLNTIVGHRDVGSTACPGNFLYAKLPGIRLRAAQNVNKPSDDQWLRSVSVDRTSVVAGDVVTFRMTIRNIYQTIPISGSAFSFGNADAGFIYDQAQCWALKDGNGQPRFPRPDNIINEANNRFRVIAGIRNWDSTHANTVTNCPVASTIDHPWRWSIGTSQLAPGATRTITGRVRFTVPGTYSVYFGIVKDWVGYPDTVCDRNNKQGACQLRPVTINVIKPTPTYAPYVRTQVVVSTVTHARRQTEVVATRTRMAIEQRIATRDVRRGSPTRTPTIRIPPTPLPAVQSVIALRAATKVMQQLRTATAEHVLTSTALANDITQTAIVATQIADDLTATAEPVTRTPTPTPTETATTTNTHTATNTATRTRINQPTLTLTRTATPSRLFTPSSVQSINLRMQLSQLWSDTTNVWALKQANPPILYAFNPTTLAQQHSVTLDGTNATLLSVNQHNTNEVFVVGRYAWDLIAVQRFVLSSGTLNRTGIWLYKTMGTPSTLMSTGRYLFLTVNHASINKQPAYGELITLGNDAVFTEVFARRRLPGPATAITNIDSGEFTMLIAGRYPNQTGYVVPLRVGQAINPNTIQSVNKPLVSLSAFVQTQGLIPAMLVVGSDGTRWTRMIFTINTRQLNRQNIQANTTLLPILLRSQPFASIGLAPNRLGFDVYYLQQNRYQNRATINTSSISPTLINRYSITQNQLYWHDGTKLYRAVITLP